MHPERSDSWCCIFTKNEYVHYRECKFNFWRMKKIWKILSLRLKWFIIRKIPVFSYSYPYTKDEGSTSILSCSWCRIFILWRYKHALEREKFQFLKDGKLCWTIFSFRLKKDSLYIFHHILCVVPKKNWGAKFNPPPKGKGGRNVLWAILICDHWKTQNLYISYFMCCP